MWRVFVEKISRRRRRGFRRGGFFFLKKKKPLNTGHYRYKKTLKIRSTRRKFKSDMGCVIAAPMMAERRDSNFFPSLEAAQDRMADAGSLHLDESNLTTQVRIARRIHSLHAYP